MAFGGVGEVEFVPVPVPAVEPFWYPAGVEPGSLGAPGVTGVIARVEARLLARRFFRWE